MHLCARRTHRALKVAKLGAADPCARTINADCRLDVGWAWHACAGADNGAACLWSVACAQRKRLRVPPLLLTAWP